MYVKNIYLFICMDVWELSWWLSSKSSFAMPKMLETQVLSLGWEDPLEEGMITHCSILAWRIPCTEEPDRLCGSAASAAAKSLQSTSDSMRPHRGQRLRPWDSPGRNTGVGCHFLLPMWVYRVPKSWVWLKRLSTHTHTSIGMSVYVYM